MDLSICFLHSSGLLANLYSMIFSLNQDNESFLNKKMCPQRMEWRRKNCQLSNKANKIRIFIKSFVHSQQLLYSISTESSLSLLIWWFHFSLKVLDLMILAIASQLMLSRCLNFLDSGLWFEEEICRIFVIFCCCRSTSLLISKQSNYLLGDQKNRLLWFESDRSNSKSFGSRFNRITKFITHNLVRMFLEC